MWIPSRLFKAIGFVLLLSLLGQGRGGSIQAQGLGLSAGDITLSSDKGDSTLLKAALELIHREQDLLQRKFALRLSGPLNVSFHYDLQEASPGLHPVPGWSGGIARGPSEIHIFARDRRSWLAILRHELFHVLLSQHEVDIPVWLNEGLAQWHAGQGDYGGFMELGLATARGDLIPLSDLDVVLSFHRRKAALAYAQAIDATRYLIRNQGESLLPYLLKKDDIGFRQRFKNETGEELYLFESNWRESLEERFWFFKISRIPTLLWALSPLIVILAWYLRKRRARRILKEWEQAEAEIPPSKFLD